MKVTVFLLVVLGIIAAVCAVLLINTLDIAGVRSARNKAEVPVVKATQSLPARTILTEEVLKSEIPVLVDLWAPWCGPCRALTPTVEDIASEYDGKLKVVKLNIDESPTIAANYSVISIPTLLIFKNGNVEGQIVGLVGKDKIEAKFVNLI